MCLKGGRDRPPKGGPGSPLWGVDLGWLEGWDLDLHWGRGLGFLYFVSLPVSPGQPVSVCDLSAFGGLWASDIVCL